MSFASKNLRRWASAALGLALLPGVAAAENMANKQPTGAVTNAPLSSFNPWGDEPPAGLPFAGGVPTEEQARRNSNCGNCDTEWCNTNYGLGYDRFPLPQWTDLPRWYGGADALYLTRDNTENITFATTGAQGVEAISTEDLNYELRPGVRLTLGRTLTNNFRLEGNYLGLQHWDDTVTVRNLNTNVLGGQGNLFSPFTGFGNPTTVPGLDLSNRVTLDTTAELQSAELNLRYRGPNRCGAWELQVLCGARYLHVNESFGYFSQASVPTPLGATNDIDVETTNDLIGGQIGGSIIYRASPRWWINFDGKAGVYGNSAEQNTVYAFTNANGATTTITGEAQEGATAFVGDIKVESCFQLLPRLTVVAGYSALGIDGLATATNNLQRDYTILTLGPAEVDHNGTVFYHGPHAGFVWAW